MVYHGKTAWYWVKCFKSRTTYVYVLQRAR